MQYHKTRLPFLLTLCLLQCLIAWGRAERFRVMWFDSPATSAVIGWDQVSGSGPVLLLDDSNANSAQNHFASQYKPNVVNSAKGMNNHYVFLRGLRPNTNYYFVVSDNEGSSSRLFFTTAPDNRKHRLSIIAGGDSRNHREARRNANMLVAKLRAHCVLFNGDYTVDDLPEQWVGWMDDWQLTIAEDGRMTPIVPARGNHEESNQTLRDVFGMPYQNAWYAFSIGGGLLRIYTLNSLMPAGGDQAIWLDKDLQSNYTARWKIAQYHHPMRPHTSRKLNKNDLVIHWARLFEKYGMDVAVECDAHVVKATWPIRPSLEPGSAQGFIRDDLSGTVYIGEGGWGAPLRAADLPRSWTRAVGSFNQFHWLFIDEEKIEIRFVKTDGASAVACVNPNNIFLPPRGLSLWSPPTGDVITIPYFRQPSGLADEEYLAARSVIRQTPNTPSGPVLKPTLVDETEHWEDSPLVVADKYSGEVKVKYTLLNHCDVRVRVINLQRKEVVSLKLPRQPPGDHLKSVWLDKEAPGRYLIIIRDDTNQRLLRRFRVVK